MARAVSGPAPLVHASLAQAYPTRRIIVGLPASGAAGITACLNREPHLKALNIWRHPEDLALVGIYDRLRRRSSAEKLLIASTPSLPGS